MDFVHIAKRISEKSKTKKMLDDVPEVSSDILDPGVEYSFKVDLTLLADFEGNVSEVPEARIRRKLKSEVLAAMKSAVLIVANDLGLRAESITINPMSITSAVNDQTSVGDMEER